MSLRALMTGALLALPGISGMAVAADSPPPAQPALTPLLPAPDPNGPATREIFLKEPDGQVDRITAIGHLVAWSVRTPAERIATDTQQTLSVSVPDSTVLAVVDERGGAPLLVTPQRPLVRSLRLVRGPGGAADPQLAVLSCSSSKAKGCSSELIALTPAEPVQVVSRRTGGLADAALGGRIDSGRRIGVARKQDVPRKKRCVPRLAITDLATGRQTRLPALPARDNGYPTCVGLGQPMLRGHFAFATVGREDPKYDTYADFFYAIDLRRGARARWHEVARPLRITGGSAGVSIGPAITDAGLWWEEYDFDDGSITMLNYVTLPRAAGGKFTSGQIDSVAPGTKNACDLVATDHALYELANPRCTDAWTDNSSPEIRRLSGAFAPRPAG